MHAGIRRSLTRFLLGLSFLAWGGVVLYVDPERAGIVGQTLFYGTLFLWLTALARLVCHERESDVPGELLQSRRRCARGSLLFALLVGGFLLLRQGGFATWWVVGLWMAAILLLELFFRNGE